MDPTDRIAPDRNHANVYNNANWRESTGPTPDDFKLTLITPWLTLNYLLVHRVYFSGFSRTGHQTFVLP
jgi:hypothetical protein